MRKFKIGDIVRLRSDLPPDTMKAYALSEIYPAVPFKIIGFTGGDPTGVALFQSQPEPKAVFVKNLMHATPLPLLDDTFSPEEISQARGIMTALGGDDVW